MRGLTLPLRYLALPCCSAPRSSYSCRRRLRPRDPRCAGCKLRCRLGPGQRRCRYDGSSERTRRLGREEAPQLAPRLAPVHPAPPPARQRTELTRRWTMAATHLAPRLAPVHAAPPPARQRAELTRRRTMAATRPRAALPPLPSPWPASHSPGLVPRLAARLEAASVRRQQRMYPAARSEAAQHLMPRLAPSPAARPEAEPVRRQQRAGYARPTETKWNQEAAPHVMQNPAAPQPGRRLCRSFCRGSHRSCRSLQGRGPPPRCPLVRTMPYTFEQLGPRIRRPPRCPRSPGLNKHLNPRRRVTCVAHGRCVSRRVSTAARP